MSEAQFADLTQYNPERYVWTNISYPHSQLPLGQINSPFLPSHLSSAVFIGYDSQSSEPLRAYPQQSLHLMKSDLAAPGSSVHHRFQSFNPSGPLQAQYASDGPSWFDQPSMTLSNPTSISPQLPATGMPKPAYPSPESKAATDPDEPVKVLSPRPRPQCWDHGCNGRKFSTFSNLLRHQRQKLGIIAKSECPICGANFTRPTARNIHVKQGKCKFSGRKSSTT